MDLMEVEEGYGKLMKQLLMPTLTDEVYTGLEETHKSNSPRKGKRRTTLGRLVIFDL